MNTSPDLLKLADLALIPPVLNKNPLPEYGYDRLDYGMTIGIERTSGGRLWACWVGGGDNEKSFFVLATSDDSGATWSDPRLVIDPHDASLPLARRTIVGNLWCDPDGRLWLFFDQAMTYFDGRAGTWFIRCDNPDADAPEWTTPVRIWHGCSLNKPIVLSSGEWLLPVSLWDRCKIAMATVDTSPDKWPTNPFADSFHELDEYRMANVLVSRDKGQTWEWRGGVAFPSPEFDEHNLIERRDGTIWMTARVGEHRGIWQSVSHDGGTTWSQAEPSGLHHVSSRHFMRRLPSGRLLLVKHCSPNSVDMVNDFNAVNARPESRSHLSAFLSDDDGITWCGGLMLDERTGVSYPDGTASPDGIIFVSYDRNRDTDGEVLLARFTEEDVFAGCCVSPGSKLRGLIYRPVRALVAARHARNAMALLHKLTGKAAESFIPVPQWLVWNGVATIDTCLEKGVLPALGQPLPIEASSADGLEPPCDSLHETWRVIEPSSRFEMLSFEKIALAETGKAGYARSFVYSPKARSISIIIGVDFWIRFSVNGQAYLDHGNDVRPACTPNIAEFHVVVPLKAGWNLLEAKVASGSGGFAFSCLLEDTGDLEFSISSKGIAPASA